MANNYGATPMSLAAEVANTDILKVLLEVGANVESPNADGQTALLAVARTGNVEAAKLLLDRGATVDANEKFGGQTPLMWASARRHPAMMQLLISKGADVNAASIDRDYQRHVTAEGRPKSLDSGGLTPLLYAARENCMACVDVLLKSKRGHRPAGSGRRDAAARGDHERQLGPGEAADRGRRRRQPVGHLRRGAALHGGRPAQPHRRRTRLHRPDRTRPPGSRSSKLLLEKGADPNMQLFFKPANVRGVLHTRGATPLIRAAVQRRPGGGEAAAGEGRRRHVAHGGPADADPRRARGPRAGAAGAGAHPHAAEGRHGRQRRRADQPPGGGARRHGAALRGPQALQGGDQAAGLATAST